MDRPELERAWQAGRKAWPDIALELDRFARHVGELGHALEAHGADLYLACACLEASEAAIAAFHRRFLDDIGRYLGSLAATPAMLDDIRQELAARLLVGENPKIADYMGRGPLEGWIRVAATRIAIDIQRRDRRDSHLDADRVEKIVIDHDADLSALKRRFREDFRVAFRDALLVLIADHRSLLRLHYLEGLTTAQVASLFAVSRATIVRRIAEARQALLDDTAKRLCERLALPADEVESLLRVMQSQLQSSLARLLGE